MILLIADPDDRHADALETALRKKGTETFRFHPEDLPLTATVTLHPGSPHVPGLLQSEQGMLSLERVRTVWMRTYRGFSLPPEWSPVAKQYAQAECTETVSGLYLHLRERFWVNPPWRLRHGADNRALQLRAAQESGLEIPPTLVTTDPHAALEFFRECQGQVLRLRMKLSPPASARAAAPEKALTLESLQDAELFRRAPVMLQQTTPGVTKVRVAVIGCRLFAAALPARPTGKPRAARASKLQPHTLPEPLGTACLAVVRRLGLASAILELGLTDGDRYVFLGIDARGDWLPLEREARLPVLDALAEMLRQGKTDFEWAGG
ncbi:ATP-grasp domain-containing protein [Hyalangium rubrum]|uniref:MvdD-like pre-ATP grasp domain-containing protein n=1 Tax=Hyalangium rubrum TaxID=3103134 RepID=A0ABU5HAE0_9BACT|nr:hypothetical protein [Hyalangium sp. s54d21]MDY7230449.1 hypothetical protein [Hyalangium sp. s54d21]